MTPPNRGAFGVAAAAVAVGVALVAGNVVSLSDLAGFSADDTSTSSGPKAGGGGGGGGGGGATPAPAMSGHGGVVGGRATDVVDGGHGAIGGTGAAGGATSSPQDLLADFPGAGGAGFEAPAAAPTHGPAGGATPAAVG